MWKLLCSVWIGVISTWVHWWSNRQRRAALRKLLPLPVLEWFNHFFFLNAWGDTDSTSWRQKSSWFKASSVGGSFFSDWAERMRCRNLPWGSELKSGQIAEGVAKVTTHTRSSYTQYMRKTTSPSSRNGTLKAKLPRLLSFRSIRLLTLVQTEAADGLRSLRFKKLPRGIKGTVHPKRKVHTNASGNSGESS